MIENLKETIATLRFGVKARCIKNEAKINKSITLDKMKEMLIL